MRITTRAVFQMTEDGFVELERDSYEYDGPVSQAGGGSGGGNTTTNTTADPWTGIRPYLAGVPAYGVTDPGIGALPWFSQTAENVPQYYPNQTYAGFDPMQLAAQGGMLNYANSPAMMGTLGNGFNAMNMGLNAADVNANPALQGYVDAAIRPLTQAYEEQILPGIRDQAEMYGGAGSRTGLAEGVASRGYMDAVGDTTANIMSQAYGQGLDQQARMMTLLPQMMQTGMMPYDIMNQVGGWNQAMTQNQINDAMARWDFGQTADYNQAKDYFSTLMGTPWGSGTSTSSLDSQSNMASSLLGGGLLGAGAGSIFGAVPAGATGMAAFTPLLPWMAGGALLGGLFS